MTTSTYVKRMGQALVMLGIILVLMFVKVQAPTMQSSIWAGIALSDSTVNSVQGRFLVPSVTCSNATANLLIWVGLGGVFDVSHAYLPQAGVRAFCDSSQLSYFAWYEVAPAHAVMIPDFNPKAGDSVSVTVTVSQNVTVTFSLTDKSQVFTENLPLNPEAVQSYHLTTGECIAERNFLHPPTPLLANVTFQSCTIPNSSRSRLLGLEVTYQVEMINPDGTVVASPSPLNWDGSFTIRRGSS